MLQRRQLLKLTAASTVAVGLSPLAHACRLRGGGQDEPAPCLVLIQLAGGNDGLNTVVPFRDDAYWDARPRIAHDEDALHRITKKLALAPDLTRLSEQFDRGRLAVQLGVGYPEPNRSHFKSMEIWHTADARGRASGPGWVGRLAGALDASSLHGLVHVGEGLPYSLHSATRAAIAFRTPAAHRFANDRGDGLRPMEPAMTDVAPETNFDFVRSMLGEARGSSAELRAAVAGYTPAVEYDRSEFSGALRVAAALIEARIGVSVISVELGGFDTHNGQVKRHAARMSELDAGLATFLDDLAGRSAAENVAVLAFSEFGRRVAENASGGTDHGTAGPLFIAGARTKRGVHGKHPSLVDLDDRGDLRHTCDFRSVYAEVIEDQFGADSREVLGEVYKKTDLLQKT